jgi:hypothetical protein
MTTLRVEKFTFLLNLYNEMCIIFNLKVDNKIYPSMSFFINLYLINVVSSNLIYELQRRSMRKLHYV